jgi:dTDP-L-rhamnose 4-epimerase
MLAKLEEETSVKALVTGGAGFIGSHLVDALLAGGHDVRVLDSLDPQVHGSSGQWPAYLSREAERIQGDIRDPATVRRALEGVRAVFHQAAAVGVAQSMYRIEHYVSVNSLGSAVLLEAAVAPESKVERLVVASSMSVYGEGAYVDADGASASPTPRSDAQLERRQWEVVDAHARPLRAVPTPETKPLQPTTVYSVSKLSSEEFFLSVGRTHQLPTVALRYFNVYGSRQALSNPYTGVAAIFSSRLLNAKPPAVNEDGEQSRDFVHVSDVVRANLMAMRCNGEGGRVYNVGTGRATTIRRLAELLAERLHLRIEPEITQRFRRGDVRHCIADITRARVELGFEPRVRLEDGIGELIECVRDQRPEDRIERATQELLRRGLAG